MIEAPIKQSVVGHLKLINRLRREKYDIALMLSPGQLIKGALYMFLAGIPIRVSHQYPSRSNPASGFLLTHSIPEDSSLHDIEQNLALLKLLDSNYSLQPTPYLLPIPPAAVHESEKLLTQLSIPLTKTIIGFHPGSARGFEWKRWPLEYWVELGKTLIENHNAYILIFGGPDEEEVVKQLTVALPNDNRSPVGDVPGKTTHYSLLPL